MEELTLEQLRQGDYPQMPQRRDRKEIKWWQVESVQASNIFYDDFSIRKGELIIGLGDAVVKADSNGLYLGNSVWADAPFRVDMSGNAYLESANIVGSISATSGVIGGFTITPTQMYGGILKTSVNAGVGESGVIIDSSGLKGFSSLLGQTFSIPTDGSAPTFSSGVINSTVFNVDTSSVIRTSDTVGDGTANSSGILINDSGLYACSTNQTLENANVRILANGEATFSGFVKGGMTDYLVGTGYFLGSSAGDYKLAVGNPNSSYLSWDGNELRIRGSIEVDGPITLESYAEVDLPIPPTDTGYNFAGGYE